MFSIERTQEFDEWLKALKDPIAKKAIITRLLRLESGNFGDVDNVGDGIFELRIHVSAGLDLCGATRRYVDFGTQCWQ